MKKSLFLAAALLLAIPLSASAGIFNVFKASIMIPVSYKDGGKFVTKTLTAKEFVNLTLGLPLDTPLNPTGHNYILALMLDFEDATQPGNPPPTPESKLVVWDTALPGDVHTDKSVATVGSLTELDFDEFGATSFKGQGIATATIAEGMADPMGNNKFFAVTLHGAGQVSEPSTPISAGINVMSSAGLKVTGLSGRVHFKYSDSKVTGKDVFGVALKGSLTTAGKPISHP